jgi:PhnB protein
MTSNIQPYLFLEGRCEEAIELYRQALGAEVQMLIRYRDAPEPPPAGQRPQGTADKVMHASLRIGDAQLLLSDGMCSGQPKFAGMAISLSSKSAAETERRYDALLEGGSVAMPLAQTFFSPLFGMVTDRFGVLWMLITEP